MKTSTCKLVGIIMSLCIASVNSFSQTCTAPPGIAANDCATPGATLLTEGANVNSGQEYYFTGTASFSSVSINGGRLRICGNLSLSNLNFNGGQIIIESAGTLNYSGSPATLNVANQELTNYGSLTMSANYVLTNNSYLVNNGVLNMNMTLLTAIPLVLGSPDAFLVNEASAQINVPGFDLNLNSNFVNRGISSFRSLTINANGSICMGEGSAILTNNIANDRTNSVSVEAGEACISYNGTALINNQLTLSPNLIICRLPGSQNPAPSGFGSAQVANPCTSCLAALPVTLESFTVSPDREQYLLKWVTTHEDNMQSFVIENSTDAINFRKIGEVIANNRPSTYTFRAKVITKTFFRLKIQDINGSYSYSKILQVEPALKNVEMVVSPNPSRSNNITVIFASPTDEDASLIVTDMTGRTIRQQSVRLRKGITNTSVSLAPLPAGIYQLTLVTNNLINKTAKLVVIE